MLDDLEEFLRRAAEQRSQQARPQPPVPPQPVQARQVVEILDEPVEAEIIEAQPLSSIGSHVQQHQFGLEVSHHADHLGEHIEQADERLEARLHSTFDHRVGNMDDSTTFIGTGDDNASDPAEAATGPSRAEEIAAMLRTPQSVRNAVILSEILTRPNW